MLLPWGMVSHSKRWLTVQKAVGGMYDVLVDGDFVERRQEVKQWRKMRPLPTESRTSPTRGVARCYPQVVDVLWDRYHGTGAR